MELFWNTFNWMFILTIVLLVIISLVCAMLVTNKTFKYREKDSFIIEFFRFLWGTVSWLFGLPLAGLICIYPVGIMITIFTLGIVDGADFIFEILVEAEAVVTLVWWGMFIYIVISEISSTFEDKEYRIDDDSYSPSYDYHGKRTYYVDEPNNPYRIAPLEYTEEDRGDRIIVTKYDPHNPKIISDRYEIKKKR